MDARRLLPLLAVGIVATGCQAPASGETETLGPSDRPGTQAIHLVNDWNRSVAMHVRVVRVATGEVVYDETHEVLPLDGTRTVYDTADTAPEGIEELAISVTVRNTTERVTIERNDCHGSVSARVDETGDLSLGHAVC